MLYIYFLVFLLGLIFLKIKFISLCIFRYNLLVSYNFTIIYVIFLLFRKIILDHTISLDSDEL